MLSVVLQDLSQWSHLGELQLFRRNGDLVKSVNFVGSDVLRQNAEWRWWRQTNPWFRNPKFNPTMPLCNQTFQTQSGIHHQCKWLGQTALNSRFFKPQNVFGSRLNHVQVNFAEKASYLKMYTFFWKKFSFLNMAFHEMLDCARTDHRDMEYKVMKIMTIAKEFILCFGRRKRDLDDPKLIPLFLILSVWTHSNR